MILDFTRLGKFSVSFDAIQESEPDIWRALMGEVAIIQAEVDFDSEEVHYVGSSKRFSKTLSSVQLPQYEPVWNAEEGRFAWRRV